MAMKLERVVPFGRSLDEYIKMFSLTPADLGQRILSVGDGPASFNAEGTALGYNIQSVDPLYVFSAEEIRARFEAVVNDIIAQVERTPEDWVWTYHGSAQGLRKNREAVTQRFCQDFDQGKTAGRYRAGELPKLDFPDGSFGLGLSSHFLFLYSDLFDQAFHLEAICETLRVCQEVRIFPLLTLMLKPSPHLEPIMNQLQEKGFRCEIETVEYELQRGGNQMLKITRA
jgi:hypothetical protein